MKTTEIILGIDPGSRTTGFGLIEIHKNKAFYISSGCIRLAQENVGEKLFYLQQALDEICHKYQPTQFAIEKIFVSKNADSALKLGQARGIALMSAYKNNLEIYEYAARKVKQLVAGGGEATKEQVQNAVVQTLSLNKKPQADAADALAIALTHSYHLKTILKMQ